MTTSARLPVTAGQPQEHNVRRLIVRTSHLAFEVEAPAIKGLDERTVAERRVAYHQAMADLQGLTPGWCPEKAEEIARIRREHLERLSEWRATLDRLRAQEG